MVLSTQPEPGDFWFGVLLYENGYKGSKPTYLAASIFPPQSIKLFALSTQLSTRTCSIIHSTNLIAEPSRQDEDRLLHHHYHCCC